jgi:uncharacterized protein YkwD
MKLFIALVMLFVMGHLFGQQSKIKVSPLASYSAEWNGKQFTLCNTAVSVSYLSEKEKEVIYIINLVRKYPILFAKTVLKNYPAISEKKYLVNDKYYFQSLVKELSTLDEMPLLTPDNLCYTSAFCHAKSAGISGYTGHDRITNSCKDCQYYSGECCSYGYDNPLEIVLQLLIDEDVPSLGHRRILLEKYQTIGVSIQPHSHYGFNAVLDFHL